MSEEKVTAEAGCSGVSYDPFDPMTMKDPFPAYDELRSQCPVFDYEDFGDDGFYVLSRYRDVVEMFGDPTRFSGRYGQGPIWVEEHGLRSDPPEHTVYRRVINRMFRGQNVTKLEPFIRQKAHELIDEFVERGSCDLTADFAGPLPVEVIGHMLGVPAERSAEFKGWSDAFMAAQNAADEAVQMRARADIDNYFDEELNRRRAAEAAGETLPDDILTILLHAEREGRPFTNEELLPLLVLLLVGGNDTTTGLITNLVGRLSMLGLWEEVSADETLWDSAIEESLRYDPPVLGLFRSTVAEEELSGCPMSPDRKVQGLYASANRDASEWDRPAEFRLDRDLRDLKKRHLSFGSGITLCPGSDLARLEARIALETLGSRLPGLRTEPGAERVASFIQWGYSRLPVRWDIG